jgi:nitroreductase
MDFMRVVGSRRCIRWFRPWQPVDPASVQRILEAARLSASPGNLQPWRAVVVVAADLEEERREVLLAAANHQRAHEQAPIWIYWFADLAAVTPNAFLEQFAIGIRFHVLSREGGWDLEAARAAILEGVPPPAGMPPLDGTMHNLAPWKVAILAVQETNAACAVASLAAVDEGLGTCLHIPTTLAATSPLMSALGVPQSFVPVWVQLVGHAAEDPAAGGQRPRRPFEDLFALGRWGKPLPRRGEVVEDLTARGLLQPQAPLPGREEEMAALARMFELGQG